MNYCDYFFACLILLLVLIICWYILLLLATLIILVCILPCACGPLCAGPCLQRSNSLYNIRPQNKPGEMSASLSSSCQHTADPQHQNSLSLTLLQHFGQVFHRHIRKSSRHTTQQTPCPYLTHISS